MTALAAGRAPTAGTDRTVGIATVWPVASAVWRRPGLWPAAAAAAGRLAVPGWWHRRPYLPLPSPELWRFRMVTAYGRPDAVPAPADICSFLEWSRSVGRLHSPRVGRRDGGGGWRSPAGRQPDRPA